MSEVTGTIKVIMETQTFDSGFSKREFVVTTAEQYPQDIKLEFVKDKCSLLDKFPVGSSVSVGYNLRGNEFNGKYYINLQAWKINAGEGAEQAPNQNDQQQAESDEVGSGLPF